MKLRKILEVAVYKTALRAVFVDKPQGSSVSGWRKLTPVVSSVLLMNHAFKNAEEAQATNELVVFKRNKKLPEDLSVMGFRPRRIARATPIEAKHAIM